MRIYASTGPLYAKPLDWALAVIAEAGFDGAELMVTQDPVTQDPDQVLAAATREGIGTPVIHGPFLLVTRRVLGTDLVTKAQRSLALAEAVGADLLVVHPPFRWQPGFQHWLIDEADDAAAAHGTRLGVENLFPVRVGSRRVRFHRSTAPENLTGFRNIVLDTSHLGVAGHDPDAAYGLLHDRIAHLHVSDNRGEGRDDHAPLGAGRLPLAQFLGRVGQDARTGRHRVGSGRVAITLELDCRPHLDDRANLVAFLRAELGKCRALLEGADAPTVLGRPDVPPTGPDDRGHRLRTHDGT